MKFEKLSDDMKSAEVEFHIQNCAEIFSRMSVRIPKNLQYVAQAIHLELCESMCHASIASNEFDAIEKYKNLSIVKDTIRKIYKRINYLVLTKSITIGQGNEFVMELSESYKQICKWLISTRKGMNSIS